MIPGVGKPILWEELSWKDVDKLTKTTKMAIIPTAACEQHGPHLPLSVDAIDCYVYRSVGGVLIGHFWVVARKSTPDEILTAADRKLNIPAIIGLLVGIAIAVIIAVAIPDLPAVIGGLIGGIGVYPVVAKYMGYTKGGRLTDKGIGVSIDSITGSTSEVEDQPNSRKKPADESTSTRISDINKSNSKNSKYVASIFHNLDKIVEFLAPYWFNSSSSNMRRGGGSS